MKPSNLLLAGALTALSASAEILQFDAYLDGLQETPPVATPATGFAQIWYDTSTDTLDYSVTFSDFIGTLTAAHFHLGAAGVPGPVVLGIMAGAPIGATSGTWSGDDIAAPIGFLDNLQDELIYVNLHSTFRPGGEIRGQMLEAQTPVPEPATWVGAGLVATLALMRRKRLG